MNGITDKTIISNGNIVHVSASANKGNGNVPPRSCAQSRLVNEGGVRGNGPPPVPNRIQSSMGRAWSVLKSGAYGLKDTVKNGLNNKWVRVFAIALLYASAGIGIAYFAPVILPALAAVIITQAAALTLSLAFGLHARNIINGHYRRF